ncbi:MAG: ATP-binding cassette domain-containing protein [Clostridiales bacterium]|nr:ATP-binding cassette domain-containing protein [Clostridiales bacterium]
MIKINQLRKVFKTKESSLIALDGVNLEVEKGEIYGVIGLSGAGKSTLIRTINRLEEPTSGEILIDRCSVLEYNKRSLNQQRKKIGMIFQHFHLLQSRNVFKNISLPLELIKMPKPEIETRVEDLLEKVGLSDKRNASISSLSGGQKQRVAIARALATSPEILLCDEATSALDPKTTLEILDLIKTLRDQLKLTVILITHEMSVIELICDRVGVLEKGQIVESGYVKNVFLNPKESITKEFVKVG